MYKITLRKELNPTVTMMEIEAPLVAKKAEPGQFIILRVNEDGERIPLTIAGYDREKGTVRIIFQIVGATTTLLNAKKEGEYIQDFVGPLGVATHIEGLKRVCIVGGGVGCAIALPIAQKLHEMGCEVTSVIGFRSKDLLILEDEFKAASDRLFAYSVVVGNPWRIVKFVFTPEEIVGHEAKLYSEDKRIPLETLRKNYDDWLKTKI